MRLATAAQVREMDRRAIQERGIPSLTLMERAAQGILEAVEELMEEDVSFRPESRGEVYVGDKSFPFTRGGAPLRKAAVFAGPGNNGGDGVAAAGLLLQRGWQVRCFLTGPREKMTPDCRAMAERLEGLGGVLEDYRPEDGEQIAWTMGADVVVDAIFGVGLHSPLRRPAADAVALINRSPAPVVSADMPSGVESDTGRILGDGVRAAVTVTFSLAKIGLFVGEGALLAGRVIVHPIGIPEELCPEGCPVDTVDAGMVRGWLPRRPADGH